MKLKYFKAQKQTGRFNKSQKVWIVHEYANHLQIRFRWRGRGRYVNGTINRFASEVGEIKEAGVTPQFYKRIQRKPRELKH